MYLHLGGCSGEGEFRGGVGSEPFRGGNHSMGGCIVLPAGVRCVGGNLTEY